MFGFGSWSDIIQTIVPHINCGIYKSWLNYKIYLICLGFLTGFGFKSQQYLYLIIRDVKNYLLAQQHIEKWREVRYLSWFGQWYHVWSICWLLSIDQCFLSIWWRALVTLNVPIGCPVEEDTTADRRLASHPINATWTGRLVKYRSFVLCLS